MGLCGGPKWFSLTHNLFANFHDSCLFGVFVRASCRPHAGGSAHTSETSLFASLKDGQQVEFSLKVHNPLPSLLTNKSFGYAVAF
jgi:hypothetical protein